MQKRLMSNPMAKPIDVASRLKYLRERTGRSMDDVARSLGVTDKEAAIAKQSNLIGSLAQLLAKANELNAAKAKRESKKAKV